MSWRREREQSNGVQHERASLKVLSSEQTNRRCQAGERRATFYDASAEVCGRRGRSRGCPGLPGSILSRQVTSRFTFTDHPQCRPPSDTLPAPCVSLLELAQKDYKVALMHSLWLSRLARFRARARSRPAQLRGKASQPIDMAVRMHFRGPLAISSYILTIWARF